MTVSSSYPDLDAGPCSGTEPVSVRTEAESVDDITTIQRVQMLSFIQIPQHGLSVLNTETRVISHIYTRSNQINIIFPRSELNWPFHQKHRESRQERRSPCSHNPCVRCDWFSACSWPNSTPDKTKHDTLDMTVHRYKNTSNLLEFDKHKCQ